MSSYPSGYGQGHEYSEQDVIDAGGSADIARESLFGYTPTMSDVREVFINNSLSFNGVDFDAMLAAHDAEVWDQGALAEANRWIRKPVNPYRAEQIGEK